MTEQERVYFNALIVDRMENAKVLKKRAMRGIKDNAVNKYSDQAHFIYELLQNADDAHAVAARFELFPDKLVFIHNGTRQFSITNPETEDVDSDAGKLGDINSITSYYSSTKTGASIGKFGIGFKAVLDYTKRPEIHDDKFHFCIEDQIVPRELPDDYPGRREGETLFVFPFSDAERAYRDIEQKLRSLSYPILFLTHLQSVSFVIGDKSGLYAKSCEKDETIKGAIAERIHLTQKDGEESAEETMWLFSREDEAGRRYSVGFPVDDNGMLRPVTTDAYCFFKTKEHTGLNFFIHAPFLLNDSREHIVAGNEHNQEMVRLLSVLAADSLLYLRDIGIQQGTRLINDNILDIIPTSEDGFSDVGDGDKLSFLPFFTAIRDKMCTEELLPTADGYACGKNAYWADTRDIVDLFSNEQLVELSGNPQARWVFCSLARRVLENSDWPKYIDLLTKEKCCVEEWLFDGYKIYSFSDWAYHAYFHEINVGFVERQPIKWLYRFYRWILYSGSRTRKCKSLPIFLNQDGKAVAAFNNNGDPNLFLPKEGITQYNFVHEDILKDKHSSDLLETIGVRQPSVADYITKIILPQYQEIDTIEPRNHFDHFKLIFNYITTECPPNEKAELEKRIRQSRFLRCYNHDTAGYEFAEKLYYPSETLKKYFELASDIWFVDYSCYLELLGCDYRAELESFLCELGVMRNPEITVTKLDPNEGIKLLEKEPSSPYGHYCVDFIEPRITNCRAFLSTIQNESAEEKSKLLWKILLRMIHDQCKEEKTLSDVLCTSYTHWPTGRGNHEHKPGQFESADLKALRNTAWIADRNGRFAPPSELSKDSLSQIYDLREEHAEELCSFLGIREKSNENNLKEILMALMTDEQRKDVELGRIVRESGFSNDEVLAILERERKKNTAQAEHSTQTKSHPDASTTDDNAEDDSDREFRELYKRQSPTRKAFLENIMREPAEQPEKDCDEEDEAEWDEYTPPVIDFDKRIKRAVENSIKEVDRNAREKELTESLSDAPKYTVAWFNALMGLEALRRSEYESGSREISISFGRVELEAGTERTLLLKQPNRAIPHWMEDLAADVPLLLQVNGREHRVMIEVASVKGYSLHTRLKKAEDIKGLELSRATARITVQSPGFLLESLQNGFAALGLSDDYDMKANLSENIKFVFGPPGTGKTTYLAREELIPRMRGVEDEKILVLAPTNKAADVLTARIMELMGDDSSYWDWLVRFGTTYDEKIENSAVYKDRSFYLPKLRRCVLVTTIARFPYDLIGGQALQELHWDRVVIDEASMIPIANIVFPLYRCTPRQFIIAGDPFQIQPVAQVEQDQNIYKMVGLDSFTNPHTEPHSYEVKLLTIQYRSVPSVGELFSKFAYGGVLKHARSEESCIKTNIDSILKTAPLNIIKFPVSDYEGIFRAKTLGKSFSPYQVYSALFAYEFAAFLANTIGAANSGAPYSIGVISPYRVQADLIERLLGRAKLPPSVRVQAGTIHGFQGDECNTIVAVFNPPPTISDRKDMFLNKLNIINVSISRARDCLFVMMPDAETKNISLLKRVNKVEQLIKSSGCYREFSTDELEELMFGRAGYLEDNTFSTSHQNVNVYGLPEKRYEVRSEDTAIDVQIHENVGSTNSID